MPSEIPAPDGWWPMPAASSVAPWPTCATFSTRPCWIVAGELAGGEALLAGVTEAINRYAQPIVIQAGSKSSHRDCTNGRKCSAPLLWPSA